MGHASNQIAMIGQASQSKLHRVHSISGLNPPTRVAVHGMGPSTSSGTKLQEHLMIKLTTIITEYITIYSISTSVRTATI